MEVRKMGIAAEIRRSPVRPALPEAGHTSLTILLQFQQPSSLVSLRLFPIFHLVRALAKWLECRRLKKYMYRLINLSSGMSD